MGGRVIIHQIHYQTYVELDDIPTQSHLNGSRLMKGAVIGLGKMGAKYWLPYAIILRAT